MSNRLTKQPTNYDWRAMNDDEIRLLIGNSNDDLARARIALSNHDFDEALDYIRNAEAMVESLADENGDE